jgi:sugar phosphate permease
VTIATRGQRTLYYGWIMAATLAVTETASWGILYYAFAVFLAPMQRDLPWSTAAITGAYSLALLVAGLAAPFVGRWLDRHGPRVLMTAGSIAGSALVFAWSRVHELPAFYLIWLGMGLAMAATLYEPAFATLTRWFVRGRNRAFLLLTVVAGFASTIFLPLANRLIDVYGWRGALTILAALLAALTILPHALVLRRRPEDLRLRPDGAPATPEEETRPSAPSGDGASLTTALHDPAFWWLAGAFCAGTLTSVAIGVYLIPYLVARGDDPGFAAAVTGLIGAAQVGARVVVTLVGARRPQATLTAGVFALQAIALLALLLSDAAAGVIAAVLLLGAGRGAVTLLRPGIVADRYGMAHFGAINGALAFFLVGAQALAPIGASIVATRFGRYEPVLWGLAGIALVAAGAMLGMSRVKRAPVAAEAAGARSATAD